ncbi:MAG: NADP-dependent oxidoreductase [Steroidobacteraceae bacterium]
MIGRTGFAIAVILGLFSATTSAAPLTMQAIVQLDPDVLQLRTVDTPRLAAGEVLIRVYAAGVNPADWKRLPVEAKQPDGSIRAAIPGYDVAGVVDSVGSGVTTFKPGDAVYARADRAFAQYVAIAATDAVLKPKRLTFEQAAGVPIAGAAGYGSVEDAKLQRGQRVAIIGAAGGAGSAAVILARSRGAKVIASAHSSQQAFLEQLGVDEFVAYDKDDVAARIRNVDAVINTADGQADKALGYVRSGGRFVSIAGMPADGACAAARVTCVQIRGTGTGLSYPDSLRALNRLADGGQFDVRVTKRYALADAGAAQVLVRAGNSMGKVVLVVDPKSGER